VQAASVALLCAAVVVVTLTAVNRMTDSDAMGTLLVADSIVARQTVFLDGYYPDVLATLSTRVELVDGRPAYMFPIGTSLIAVPVVAVLRAMDIGIVANDHTIQIGMAAAAGALVVLLLYLLARRFVGHWTALALSAVFWFGSSLASTGATALWSHDFGAVLSLLALLLLVIAVQDRRRWPIPALGVVLVLAVVVRPQLALLVAGVVVVLLLTWWRAALALLAVVAVAGALLLVLNQWATGQWAPGYYLPQRLEGGDFWTALAGNLVSPARGLLVFTPFLIALPLLAWARGRLTRSEVVLLGLGLAWPLVHLVAISRFPHWWGGWAYGPRLMMDALPGLFLATVVLWPRALDRARSRVAVGAVAGLALVSIWINTVQGLYNPYTRFWYVEPSIDVAPELLWDWSYPQFLASEEGHERRLEARLPEPAPLVLGTEHAVGDPALGLVGWSTGFTSPGVSLDSFQLGPSALLSEEGRRWSEGQRAGVIVQLEPQDAAAARELALRVDAIPGQPVQLDINGVPAYDGIVGADRAVITADVPPGALLPGRNVITVALPDAVQVGQASDYREIAIALRSLSLR
jgi:hypothetical protein